jgi:hypothetical protein
MFSIYAESRFFRKDMASRRGGYLGRGKGTSGRGDKRDNGMNMTKEHYIHVCNAIRKHSVL